MASKRCCIGKTRSSGCAPFGASSTRARSSTTIRPRVDGRIGRAGRGWRDTDGLSLRCLADRNSAMRDLLRDCGCRFELRTTPSSETARRWRWSGATARSTGCACPVSTAARVSAALLGGPEHGRWLIAPTQNDVRITRRYLGDTLILETIFTTAQGSASLTDFMYRRDGSSELVRIVRGLQGQVSMRTEVVVRFDYGAVVPWVSQQEDGRLLFIAGPDRLLLDTEGSDARRGSSHASAISPSARAKRPASFSTGRRRFAPPLRRSQRRNWRTRANKSIPTGLDGRPHSSRRSAGATPFFARF